ncbi:MAG: endopeptidase La [Acidimicrobiales bacterium]|nr:endopeptidase La [Acidimicrobiales bacterium]
MSTDASTTAPGPGAIRTVPVVPTSGVVLPEMVVTIKVESPEAVAAVAAAPGHDDHVVLVPRDAEASQAIGTLAHIEQRGQLPGGGDGLVIRGVARVRVGRGSLDDGGSLVVETTVVDPGPATADTVALADRYRAAATRLLRAIGGAPMARLLHDVEDPGALADTIAWWPELSTEQRIELLEATNTDARLRLAIDWAEAAAVEAEVNGDINRSVSDEIDSSQREAVLRRQLAAIQNELGEGDGDAVGAYREQLVALIDGGVAEAVTDAIGKEIERLEQQGPQSQESSWIRTWLDTMFEIPWTNRSEDDLDLARARGVLDDDHTGLDDVKERIVEFLAVRRLREEREVDGTPARGGTILALAGPPGVGKTSLGRSVARTLGREFVRMSLGGIHDEAEIRGHRRTYVGARPGRIVRALTEAGAMNPVVLLDEIDKVGQDYRGDPSAALLEVLDPEQNDTFRDHYLEVDLDLSDVVFIATANEIERLPAPLLDRMEVIPLRGYSEDEKIEIARDHLLPRVFEQNAVRPEEVVVDDDLVRTIVGDYTREAGVRSLERRLDRLVRRAATRVATGEATPIVIDEAELEDALGRPALREDPAERTADPGVATGLAVTGAGGDVLFVETAVLPGEGLTLTGQLGDVMQESGQIALSYLRANAERIGIDLPEDRRIHVHFPAGATPKDGPSAGVTMTVALVSLLTGRRVRGDVAMTGEVTLQGRVLPIGGVKEKVLAAHRAGVTDVILPIANGRDVDDIPETVRDEVTIHLVSTVSEALAVALAA